MKLSSHELGLRSVLDAVGPYLTELVLVGGWAVYLHLNYGRAAPDGGRTSLTAEADLLIPGELDPAGRAPLAQLLEQAGFEDAGRSRVVWVRNEKEKIEFFLPNRGPAMGSGRPVPVPGQSGIQAMTLDDLEILARFRERIRLPVVGGAVSLTVQVPTLGAFVVNKAVTFSKRSGRDRRIHAGKDLLYLRDVSAAGRVARRVLKGDLIQIHRGDGGGRLLRQAHYLLSRVVDGRFEGAFHESAGMLVERDDMVDATARADLEGHLTDLCEILGEVA